MHRSLSFFDQATDSVAHFFIRSRFPIPCGVTHHGLVGIMYQLARYEEEGKQFYPKVIVTNNLDVVRTILGVPFEAIVIEEACVENATFAKCMKYCAPLALGEWHIFLERNRTTVRYGLLRTGNGVFAATPEQSITDPSIDLVDDCIIFLRQESNGVVKATSYNGASLTLAFFGQERLSDGNVDHVKATIRSITTNCGEDYKVKLENVLWRIFRNVIEQGHGSLVVVVDDSVSLSIRSLEGMSDGVWLADGFDLSQRVQNEIGVDDSELATACSAAVDLVSGMMKSDGITVFSNSGRLLGYRVFARPVTDEERNVASGIGGARKRTFALLKSRLGSGQVACFMISQDGGTEYYDCAKS